MEKPPLSSAGPEINAGPTIAHVGIAVRGLAEGVSFYRDILGMPEVPMSDSDGAKIMGLAAGNSLVELLEAETPDSPIGRFIEKRGAWHSPHLLRRRGPRRGASALP
jgi:catechol 2,3-dioxygenase-like lactoylglutathione lyase family enzyme